jgi:hypothetical protein
LSQWLKEEQEQALQLPSAKCPDCLQLAQLITEQVIGRVMQNMARLAIVTGEKVRPQEADKQSTP